MRDSRYSTTEYLVDDGGEKYILEDGDGHSRNETIQRQIQHSNVGYDDRSYVVVDDDRKRWNLPKVPSRRSTSNETHTSSSTHRHHHQARSGYNQDYMDSIEEENNDSRIVSVINQPPLNHKEYRQSSTFRQSSSSNVGMSQEGGSRFLGVINQPPLLNKDFHEFSSSQDRKISQSDRFHQDEHDEDFFEEDESRVISVLSEHPQEKEHVKWQTIADAPNPISNNYSTTTTSNTKQLNNQSELVTENEVTQATIDEVFQEFRESADHQRSEDVKSLPYPSEYAVVQKNRFRMNNPQNEQIQYNNQGIRKKRSVTIREDPEDDDRESSRKTSQQQQAARTEYLKTSRQESYNSIGEQDRRPFQSLQYPEDGDRKISQTSTTTSTISRKISQQQPARTEYLKTSRQESYNSIGDQERQRVRKMPVTQNLQASRQEFYNNNDGRESYNGQEQRTIQKESSKVEQDLKDWMDLQRKETDKNRYDVNESIATQNVLVNGTERWDLPFSSPSQKRGSSLNTLDIIPESDNVVTGQHIPESYSFDDNDYATDSINVPKTAALQSSNDQNNLNQPYFAEDFIDQTDDASSKKMRGDKKKTQGFFSRLKNKFSSSSSSSSDTKHEDGSGDDSSIRWGKQCLGEIMILSFLVSRLSCGLRWSLVTITISWGISLRF